MWSIKGSVGVEDRLSAGSFSVPVWAIGKAYQVGDLVRDSGVVYVAGSTHTAGATFAADVANWSAVSPVESVQVVTTSSTVAAWGQTILLGPTAANVTVTLPTAAGNSGRRITFIRRNSNAFTVTLAANGAETLDLMSAGSELNTQHGVVTVEAIVAGSTGVRQVASVAPPAAGADTIQALSATGAVTAWSSLVLVTSAAAATVTLPAALLANVGHRVTVKSLGAGAVTIAPNGADALQGAAVLAQFEAATYEVTAAATVVRVDNAAGAGTGTPVASFLRGSRSSGQSVASHNAVVFTTVDASAGTDISLNTTTGHITLKAGKTYRLVGSVVSSITSAQRTQWRWLNVTAGGIGFGAAQVFYSPADTAANSASGSPATAIISPSVDTVVLLQNTSLLTSDAGGNPDFGGVSPSVHPWFEVEVIGGQESAVVVPATPLHVVSIATSTPDVNAVTTVLTESGVGGYFVPSLTDPMLTKFDPNGMISGNKVVILQAGRYRLAAGARVSSATPEPGIRVNGIYVATGDHFGSSELLSYEAVRSLSAGDIVDFAITATAVASSANGFYLTVEQLPAATVVDPGMVPVTSLAQFSTGFVGTTWATTSSITISSAPIHANPATANTTAPVPFNNASFTVSKNVGGFAPTATGVTVPTTGTYSVTYRADVNTTTSGGSGAQLIVGGAVVNFGKFGENSSVSTTDGQLTLSWLGDITAGQTIQVAHIREVSGGADSITTARLVIDQVPSASVLPTISAGSYVPAITATANPTKGTVTQDRASWQIVGKQLTLSYTLLQGAIGTAGTGVYRIPLGPTGATIDTSKVYVNATPDVVGGTILGSGQYTGNGNFLPAYVLAYDANNLAVRLFDGAGYIPWGNGGTAGGGFNSTQLSLSFTCEIPIV